MCQKPQRLATSAIRLLAPDVLPPPTPPGIPTTFAGDQSWTDLMLGGRLKKTFGERWDLTVEGGFGNRASALFNLGYRS
jgi:hypothetical protein